MLCTVLSRGSTAPVSGQDTVPDDNQNIPAHAWIVLASPGCDGCGWLKRTFLPGLRNPASQPLPPVWFVDLDMAGGYELLMQIERVVGTEGTTFPALLIGNDMRYGRTRIQAAREKILRDGFSQQLSTDVVRLLRPGGPVRCFFEKPPTTSNHETNPVPSPAIVVPDPSSPSAHVTENDSARPHSQAHVLYFDTPGCRGCRRADKQVIYLRHKFPDRKIATVSAFARNGRALQMAVATRLGVPTEKRLAAPMFASESRALYGTALTDQALVALLRTSDTEPFWWTWDETTALATADQELRRLGTGLKLTTLAAVALADGVNPCAFAVITFLVSYLTLGGRLQRRMILVHGFAFCAGVFILYFLIGIGLTKILEHLQRMRPVYRTVLGLMGVACVVLGVAAARDAVAARRNGAQAMRFGMPETLRNLAHRLIRQRVGKGAVLAGTFGLGFVVSGIELVCTGQVYFPAIGYIADTAPTAQIYGYLLWYNAFFILPLLAVVAAGAYGLSSRKLAAWGGRHAALTRALVAAVLLLLGGALVSFAATG